MVWVIFFITVYGKNRFLCYVRAPEVLVGKNSHSGTANMQKPQENGANSTKEQMRRALDKHLSSLQVNDVRKFINAASQRVHDTHAPDTCLPRKRFKCETPRQPKNKADVIEYLFSRRSLERVCDDVREAAEKNHWKDTAKSFADELRQGGVLLQPAESDRPAVVARIDAREQQRSGDATPCSEEGARDKSLKRLRQENGPIKELEEGQAVLSAEENQAYQALHDLDQYQALHDLGQYLHKHSGRGCAVDETDAMYPVVIDLIERLAQDLQDTDPEYQQMLREANESAQTKGAMETQPLVYTHDAYVHTHLPPAGE